MSYKKRFVLPLALCATLTPFAGALASDDLPPQGSLPLSGILQAVEQKNAGRITDASYDDDGHWEVKVCETSGCKKLYLNPTTGAETRRENKRFRDRTPPASAKPASEVARMVETREQGQISDMEFERGRWKIELRQGNDERKLYVNIAGETTIRR